MMNLLKLNSVGSVLDSETGIVYPQLDLPNGDVMPDLNCGISLVCLLYTSDAADE